MNFQQYKNIPCEIKKLHKEIKYLNLALDNILKLLEEIGKNTVPIKHNTTLNTDEEAWLQEQAKLRESINLYRN